MIVGSSLSNVIGFFDWGDVPSWLTLVLAAITIYATARHFNNQPKEEIHPMITISNDNDSGQKDESKIVISFWATNKSNIPVSLAFQGVRLVKDKNGTFDRLGNDFCYDYLNINQTTRVYKCSLKKLKDLFPMLFLGKEKLVFGFTNEINQLQLSQPVNIKTMIKKVY